MHSGSIWRRCKLYRIWDPFRNWPPSGGNSNHNPIPCWNYSDFYDYGWRIDPHCNTNNSRRRSCIADYRQAKCRVEFKWLSCAYSIERRNEYTLWGNLFIGCHAFHDPLPHRIVVVIFVSNGYRTVGRSCNISLHIPNKKTLTERGV